MTAPEEVAADRSAANAIRRSAGVYRWRCPICAETRMGIASGNEDPREKAAFSIREHVRSMAGAGHGPTRSFPDGFDPESLSHLISVG